MPFSEFAKRVVTATVIVFLSGLLFEVYCLFFDVSDSRKGIGEHVLEKRQGMDFGDWQTIRLCIRLDDRLHRDTVSPFAEALDAEMAPYKLRFAVSVMPWKRSHHEKREFWEKEILSVDLPDECDRLLFLTPYDYSPVRYVISGHCRFSWCQNSKTHM